MKKTLLFMIIAAQALLISGCKKDDNARSNEGIYQQMSQVINELPEELAFPDGSVIPKDDLDIKFSIPGIPDLDFAFIRYAEPVFISTLDDPDIVGFDEFEMREDSRYEFEPEWIKVQEGDVLENGLKVVSALTQCLRSKDDAGNTSVDISSGPIRLEGEITFDGLLTYNINGGDQDLLFFPDTVKEKIPLSYSSYPNCTGVDIRVFDEDRAQALVYDGGYFHYVRFKSAYSSKVGDFKDMFTEDMFCKAKVTFKDIVLLDGNKFDSEITKIELET